MKVINIFGGPGIGKSTAAAAIFWEFKLQGINCELVTEYAKDLTWEESWSVMENQLWIFANQHQRLFRLKDKVDVAITDAPLFNSIVYNKEEGKPGYLTDLVKHEASKYENHNILLQRTKPYVQVGRTQTLEEAIGIDARIQFILDKYYVPHTKTTLTEVAKTALNLIRN